MKTQTYYYNEEAYNLITGQFPFFIAHEYKRLYELLDAEEYIGAFLEIKDIAEIVLKLPVLQICAYVEHSNDQDGSGISCVEQFLRKPMSLGDWKQNCFSMYKMLRKNGYPEAAIVILKNLSDFYDKKGIVAWRNDAIGHGAFFLDMNIYFQNVNTLLQSITEFLVENADSYLAMPILVNGKQLKGTDWLPAMEEELEDLTVTGHFQGKEYRISPYIQSNCNFFYFFDSHIGARSKTSLLDYINGGKNKKTIGYFNEKYRQYISTAADKKKKKTIGKLISIQEDDFLGMLNYEKEYVPSDALEKCFHTWVDSEEYDRGVFLLKMNRGMGKTAFVSNHDPLVNGETKFVNPDELVLRSYYCSRQSYRAIYDFVSTCNEALFSKMGMREESLRGSDGALPKIDLNQPDYQQQMCDYLSEYLEIYEELNDSEKICLVIDGLDEIPVVTEDDASIFDFIPTPDMLPEGVYIILTARIGDETEEMIPDSIRSRIDHLALTDQRTIRRNDPINKSNMLHFLEEKWPKAADEAEREQIIRMAEYNFVNLKLLTEVAHLKSTEEILQADHEAIFDLYLNCLRKQYGKKRYSVIKDLLFIIASEQEALTLDELAFLMGYDELTFDFLGVLRDIQALIRIERSINGNRYTLANETHRRRILDSFSEQLPGLLEGWMDSILDFKKMGEEKDEAMRPGIIEERRRLLRTTGMSYLMAYILKYVEMVRPESLRAEMEKRVNTLEFAKAIMSYELSFECMNYGHRGISRDCCMNSNVITICEKLENAADKQVQITLGRAYNCLGLQYGGRFNHYSKGIPYYLKAVEVISGMEECEDKDVELGKMYNNLGYAMTRAGSYSCEEIQEKFVRSISHRRKYAEQEYEEGVERLMVTLGDFMGFLIRNGELEEALQVYQETCRIYDEIRERYPDRPYALILTNNRYEYGYECLKIMADNSYGTILLKQADAGEKAEQVFRAALERFREMDKATQCCKKTTTVKIQFCQALANYGMCKLGNGKTEEALEAFEELLEELLKLGEEKKSFRRTEFSRFVQVYGEYLEKHPDSGKMEKLETLGGYL